MRIVSALLILCLIATVSCSPFSATQVSLKNSDDLAVYALYPVSTPAEEQTNAKNYVLEYEVTRTVLLADYEVKRLQNSLSNPDAFHDHDHEDCPFMAQYGIIAKDGSSLVLGEYACRQAAIGLPAKSGGLEAYSLSEEVQGALTTIAFMY